MIRRCLGAISAVAVVIFSLSNTQTVFVSIWPLPWRFSMPLYVLVFVPFVLGLLVGGISGWFSARRSSVRSRFSPARKRLSSVGADSAHAAFFPSRAKPLDILKLQ